MVPASASARTEDSHLTGEITCRFTSDRSSAGSDTSAPTTFSATGNRGAEKSIASIRSSIAARAGSISGEWNAPATRNRIARTFRSFASASARSIAETEPEITDQAEPVRLEPVRGRVTFEQVTFAYDGVRQVLRGVSFEVQPGEMIGLVGPSGGGKTTVVNLIARFYDVASGRGCRSDRKSVV